MALVEYCGNDCKVLRMGTYQSRLRYCHTILPCPIDGEIRKSQSQQSLQLSNDFFLMPPFKFSITTSLWFLVRCEVNLCVTSLRMLAIRVKFGYFSLVFLFLPPLFVDNLRCKIANLVLFTLYGFNDGYIVPSLRVARVFMPKSTPTRPNSLWVNIGSNSTLNDTNQLLAFLVMDILICWLGTASCNRTKPTGKLNETVLHLDGTV